MRAISANVDVDPSVVRRFHKDSSGVVTVGHELYHVEDFQENRLSEARLGDQPNTLEGPAEQSGIALEQELPDISEEEAAKILDELLAIQ